MISICEDPAKAEAYKKDPEAFVRSAGLPEHLISIVISGGRYAFRLAALGGILRDGDGGGGPDKTVVVVVVIVVVVLP